MERHKLSQGEEGQENPTHALWQCRFEAKPVLKHLAGSGPEVQKRNFQ